MNPAVGKSGPVTSAMRSRVVTDGSSATAIAPFRHSVRLWGGMLVAMPTAIPVEPLTSRLGARVGSTVGSSSFSS